MTDQGASNTIKGALQSQQFNSHDSDCLILRITKTILLLENDFPSLGFVLSLAQQCGWQLRFLSKDSPHIYNTTQEIHTLGQLFKSIGKK